VLHWWHGQAAKEADYGRLGDLCQNDSFFGARSLGPD